MSTAWQNGATLASQRDRWADTETSTMAGFDLTNKIHFLTVDPDVLSRSSLEPLATAVDSAVSILYLGREGSLYGAHFELTSYYQKDADALIQGFVSLVQKLPPHVRKLWNGARSRDFNIGIQAAAQPRYHELAAASSDTGSCFQCAWLGCRHDLRPRSGNRA